MSDIDDRDASLQAFAYCAYGIAALLFVAVLTALWGIIL